MQHISQHLSSHQFLSPRINFTFSPCFILLDIFTISVMLFRLCSHIYVCFVSIATMEELVGIFDTGYLLLHQRVSAFLYLLLLLMFRYLR